MNILIVVVREGDRQSSIINVGKHMERHFLDISTNSSWEREA